MIVDYLVEFSGEIESSVEFFVRVDFLWLLKGFTVFDLSLDLWNFKPVGVSAAAGENVVRVTGLADHGSRVLKVGGVVLAGFLLDFADEREGFVVAGGRMRQ